MNDEWMEEEKDPDYKEFHRKLVFDRNKVNEEDTKNKTIDKIKAILKDKFRNEIQAKEHEIAVISERINDTKVMLDRLRAYVIASYYGSGESVIPTTKAVPTKRRKPEDSKNIMNGNADNLLIDKTFKETFPEYKITNGYKDEDSLSVKEEIKKNQTNAEPHVINRFYVTHKVIVGNVSKYLGNDLHKENDKSTHKWMVYVRGPKADPDISSYIKSVWFFLHPSYIPNDIVQVHNPPFQITRRGWGEFPVRVQLHFKDSRSKRFDIIHHLKLDKTYTGLQTLGAETIVNLELHRHTKDGFVVISKPPNSNTEDYEPLTKPITELICDTSDAIPDAKPLANNDSMKHFSPLHCTASIKKEFDDLSLCKSVNSNGVKNEQDITSSIFSLNMINHKKEELLKLLPLNSSHPSLVSSCVTSASTSRCSSPVRRVTFSKNSSVFDNETDSILRRLVTSARLICPNENLRFQSFTCPSLEEYKMWSFSKRRASEWQRAAFVKKLFYKHVESTHKKICVPSTKQIMIWCRKNTFTPPERKSDVITASDEFSFCHLCGVICNEPGDKKSIINTWCKNCISSVHINQNTFDMKTPYNTMLNSIRLKEETLRSLNHLEKHKDNDEYVDVVNTNNKPITKQPVVVEIIPSNELHWIYNTANNIDIHLPTLTINGVRGPFLQAMLATATKCFVSELLTKSYVNTGETNSTTLEPSMITYSHLFKAIQENAKFDFLTDAYMCKMEDENISVLLDS